MEDCTSYTGAEGREPLNLQKGEGLSSREDFTEEVKYEAIFEEFIYLFTHSFAHSTVTQHLLNSQHLSAPTRYQVLGIEQ